MTNQDMLLEATDFVQDMLGMGVKNPFLINEKTGKQSRDRCLMEARHLIRYYLKSTYRLSWSRIGEICNCNHATVIWSYKFVEDMSTYDKRFKLYVDSIRKRKTRYSLSMTDKVRDVFKNNTGDGLRVSALVRLFNNELEKQKRYELET